MQSFALFLLFIQDFMIFKKDLPETSKMTFILHSNIFEYFAKIFAKIFEYHQNIQISNYE